MTVCAVATLPTTRRIVAVTPLGGGRIQVDAIRDANVLFWRRRDFPGQMEDTGWQRDAGGYGADGSGAPLVASIDGLDEDLEVRLSAPGPSRVLIASDGFAQFVAPPPSDRGGLSVIVPARPAPLPATGFSLACVTGLATSFLLWLLLLRGLARA